MKGLFNKYILSSTAILISCIIVYGITYAQQVCCSTMIATCIPASNRIFGGCTSDGYWANSQSYDRNNLTRSNLCSKNVLANFGSENACCETDQRDNYKQTTKFSFPFIQDFYPLQKNASSLDAGNATQTAFESFRLPTSLKVVPIYIIIQSIVCWFPTPRKNWCDTSNLSGFYCDWVELLLFAFSIYPFPNIQ